MFYLALSLAITRMILASSFPRNIEMVEAVNYALASVNEEMLVDAFHPEAQAITHDVVIFSGVRIQ